MNYCFECGKELDVYDIGLHKKIVNRGAETYRCISCNGKHFCVPEEALWEKIRLFQRQGCTLFPKKEDDIK